MGALLLRVRDLEFADDFAVDRWGVSSFAGTGLSVSLAGVMAIFCDESATPSYDFAASGSNLT
jgi:hypothetical protein